MLSVIILTLLVESLKYNVIFSYIFSNITYSILTCLGFKKFKNGYFLKRHMLIHTNERNFMCEICGKCKNVNMYLNYPIDYTCVIILVFLVMSALTQHQTTHTSLKPYVCEICSKSYKRISGLIAHRNIHTKKKVYSCATCCKTFHVKGLYKYIF